MAGDTHIAGLAGQRRSRVVARPHLQICFGHTLHHVPAEAYGRYDQVVESAAGGRDGEGGAYKSPLAADVFWVGCAGPPVELAPVAPAPVAPAPVELAPVAPAPVELALAATGPGDVPAAAGVPGAAPVDLLTGAVAGGT